MTNDFWREKKVFLTGHTGFKGSWLSLWLQQMGAQVTGFALSPPTNPSLFEVASVATGMDSIIGDIRDAKALGSTMRQAAPEIVIHMAAQPLVRYSYSHPVETYATNVMGTVHVLEAVRQTPSVRAVVNVTSDKCYENTESQTAYREQDRMGGYDPYSSSKGCAELVTAAYRNSYFHPQQFEQHGVALASVRAGNVIGGGDWADDRLIPDIVRALGKGEAVLIRNPHAIRPWQHVLEPLSGYLMLAQKLYEEGPDYAEAWNFGPDEADAKPVQWIVEQLVSLWGASARWTLEGGEQPHETNYLRLDSRKAHNRLAWQPRLDLSHALHLVVEWQRALETQQDMRAYTLQQIERYSH